MPTSMLLGLRFRPGHRAPSPYEVAAVMEEVEALYVAAPKAVAGEEPLRAHLLAEHRARFERTFDLSEATLSEIEQRVRAIKRLEALGADSTTVDLMWRTVRVLADAEGRRLLQDGRPAPGMVEADASPLEIRRLSMASPLELILSIPAAYWASGGFLLFLAALERRFNMVGRIRTERIDLAARRAERQADQREAEVREETAKQALATLRERTGAREEPLLEGLQPAQQQFELEDASLWPEDADARDWPVG